MLTLRQQDELFKAPSYVCQRDQETNLSQKNEDWGLYFRQVCAEDGQTDIVTPWAPDGEKN